MGNLMIYSKVLVNKGEQLKQAILCIVDPNVSPYI